MLAACAISAALTATSILLCHYKLPLFDLTRHATDANRRQSSKGGRAHAPYFLNWGLWDYSAQGTCNEEATYNDPDRWGVGASAEAPRSAFAEWAQKFGQISNGDFESNLSGWAQGGNGEMIWGGPGPDGSQCIVVARGKVGCLIMKHICLIGSVHKIFFEFPTQTNDTENTDQPTGGFMKLVMFLSLTLVFGGQEVSAQSKGDSAACKLVVEQLNGDNRKLNMVLASKVKLPEQSGYAGSIAAAQAQLDAREKILVDLATSNHQHNSNFLMSCYDCVDNDRPECNRKTPTMILGNREIDQFHQNNTREITAILEIRANLEKLAPAVSSAPSDN